MGGPFSFVYQRAPAYAITASVMLLENFTGIGFYNIFLL